MIGKLNPHQPKGRQGLDPSPGGLQSPHLEMRIDYLTQAAFEGAQVFGEKTECYKQWIKILPSNRKLKWELLGEQLLPPGEGTSRWQLFL